MSEEIIKTFDIQHIHNIVSKMNIGDIVEFAFNRYGVKVAYRYNEHKDYSDKDNPYSFVVTYDSVTIYTTPVTDWAVTKLTLQELLKRLPEVMLLGINDIPNHQKKVDTSWDDYRDTLYQASLKY